MAKVEVTTEVSKESYELGQGIAGFVGAAKTSLTDGWQLGEDLPALVAAAMANLIPAIDGLDKVPEELQEDAGAFMKAWMMAGADIYALFKKEA